jgi:Ca2+-dependent lipid-binding protein
MADIPIESMRIRTPPSTEDDVIIIEVNKSVHPNDMKNLQDYKNKIKHSDKMIDISWKHFF